MIEIAVTLKHICLRSRFRPEEIPQYRQGISLNYSAARPLSIGIFLIFLSGFFLQAMNLRERDFLSGVNIFYPAFAIFVFWLR